jgi:hypothetical protein
MLGDLAILQSKHVEAESLVVLTIVSGPTLANINHDHVVLANDIQQVALVIGRQGLGETGAKRIHEALQAGRESARVGCVEMANANAKIHPLAKRLAIRIDIYTSTYLFRLIDRDNCGTVHRIF